jgi:hypothetical protein
MEQFITFLVNNYLAFLAVAFGLLFVIIYLYANPPKSWIAKHPDIAQTLNICFSLYIMVLQLVALAVLIYMIWFAGDDFILSEL